MVEDTTTNKPARNINKHWKNLKRCIIKTAKKWIGKKKSFNTSKPWFTPSLTNSLKIAIDSVKILARTILTNSNGSKNAR